MTALLVFLGAFIPKAKPYLDSAPELLRLIRSAFKKAGGKGEDLEAILAANQVDIDRLARPDDFRKLGKKKGNA